jgi:hypothetical protein
MFDIFGGNVTDKFVLAHYMNSCWGSGGAPLIVNFVAVAAAAAASTTKCVLGLYFLFYNCISFL